MLSEESQAVFLAATIAAASFIALAFTAYICVWFRKKSDTSSQASEHEINGDVPGQSENATKTGDEKRASKRKLPEIPDVSIPVGPDEIVDEEDAVDGNRDTGSELYAQVGANIQESRNVNGDPASSPATAANSDNLPNSNDLTIENADVKHNYSKIKKKAEHPYARVKRADTIESKSDGAEENETDTDNYDVVCVPTTVSHDQAPAMLDLPDSQLATLRPSSSRGSRSSLVSGNDSAPRPPPRGRRVQSAIVSASNIPEANGVGENDDPANAEPNAAEDANPRAQIYFSGDSQASQDSRGYSSISVREPIANLKAREGVRVRRRSSSINNGEIIDPHYATVSDAEDSDEMYAAIAEPSPLYAGGGESDTYAKIGDENQEVALAAAPAHEELVIDEEQQSIPHPPTPPSVVSLRQLSLGSGRLNASTLSVASQTSGYGSPKPEKRQANSPLPPPPIAQLDNRRSFNIEDMYAKVIKKKGLSVSRQLNAHHRGSVDLGLLHPRPGDSHNGSRRNSMESAPNSLMAEVSINIVEDEAPEESAGSRKVSTSTVDEEEEDRYEELPSVRKASESDPGYERITLKNHDSFNDPRYERIRAPVETITDPNYEVVRYGGSSEPGYEEVQTVSIAFDPNYESLNYSTSEKLCEPPYERLEDSSTPSAANDSSALYARVLKPKRPVEHSVKEEEEDEGEEARAVNVLHEGVDFTVNSSENNTTIIRIHDNSALVYSFPDGDSLGIPEHV